MLPIHSRAARCKPSPPPPSYPLRQRQAWLILPLPCLLPCPALPITRDQPTGPGAGGACNCCTRASHAVLSVEAPGPALNLTRDQPKDVLLHADALVRTSLCPALSFPSHVTNADACFPATPASLQCQAAPACPGNSRLPCNTALSCPSHVTSADADSPLRLPPSTAYTSASCDCSCLPWLFPLALQPCPALPITRDQPNGVLLHADALLRTSARRGCSRCVMILPCASTTTHARSKASPSGVSSARCSGTRRQDLTGYRNSADTCMAAGEQETAGGAWC